MESLLTLLGSYTFAQVMFLLIVVFLLYLVYLKMTDDDYYSELQDIKTKYRARMWEFTSGELRIIEAHSLDNVEKLLGLKGSLDITSDKQKQFAMFSLVLERTLHHTIFEAIKTAIRVNGFHNMNPEELEQYIKDKADVLLRESRKSINGRIMYYPMLRGTEEKRFTVEQSEKFFGKIVKKSIKLYSQEQEEIKKLKKKYSLWTKINFIGALINKFKKVS